MAINIKPLKLYDLAAFQVVVASSFENPADNLSVSTKIPKLRLKNKPLKPKLLRYIQDIRYQCKSKIRHLAIQNPQKILSYYMKGLFESYIHYQNTLEHVKNVKKRQKLKIKKHRCYLKLVHFIPYVEIERVIDDVYQLFEIESCFLMRILHHVKEFMVLNNFLILGAFYGFKNVVRVAAVKGADDFDTAKKACCLRQNFEMTEYLTKLDGTMELSIHGKTTPYRDYYSYIRTESFSSFYKQFLAEDHLKSLINEYYPFHESGLSDWIEDFDLPITCWADSNLLRTISVLSETNIDKCVKMFVDKT